MASTDATAIPVKNQAYRVTFPIWDADGDLVTGATGLDSEVSKDAGTFTDCTSEATEIATNSGMYYIDLTNTEMNADTVAIVVKTSSVGAKTTPIILYPQEAGDINVDVTYWNGTAVATPATAGIPDVNVKNIDNDATSASGTVTFPNATLASTTNITGGTITTVTNLTNNNDKTGYALSAGGIQAIWDALTSALTTVGSVGKAIADNLTGNAFTRLGAPVGASISADIAGVQADTDNIQTRIPAALVSGRMDASVGAMAANAVTAAALAADAVNEIADGVLDRNMATGTDSGSPTVRTVRQALRFLRNKWDAPGGALSVRKEDDLTVSWTGVLTTDASADPVVGNDPA